MTEDEISQLSEKLKTQFGNSHIVTAVDPFVRAVAAVIDDVHQNGGKWLIDTKHDIIDGVSIFMMASGNPHMSYMVQSRDGIELKLMHRGVKTKIQPFCKSRRPAA